MSGVNLLTIPESAYDPSYFLSPQNRRKSRLFLFLVRLCNGSALAITLAYILGFLAIKPLLELNKSRQLDLLEKLRGRLRDCYLNLIGRVSQIPIVTCQRKNGSNKYFADAICQTPNSYMRKSEEEIEEERIRNDKFYHGQILSKLETLKESINKCTSYLISEMPHYELASHVIKDLHNKSDLEYYDVNELLSTTSLETNKSVNHVNELKREIRGIKGLFMSGQI